MHPRLFQFGHVAIPTYGVFAALALISALGFATRTARRLDLDPNKIWNLGLIGIFSVLLGSRLLLILFHPSDFLAHPFWMLGLITIRSNVAFYGSLLIAICACIGYIFVHRLPMRLTLDCLAPAAALGLGIRSLGTFFGGSDYGSPTTAPWGVVYMHRLASLWSGTPLGIRLHPVQLYEAAIFFALFVMLAFLLSREKPEGSLAGIFLFVYGATLFFLDFYRGDRSFVLRDALSIEQILGIALVLAGSPLLVKTSVKQQPVSE